MDPKNERARVNLNMADALFRMGLYQTMHIKQLDFTGEIKLGAKLSAISGSWGSLPAGFALWHKYIHE